MPSSESVSTQSPAGGDRQSVIGKVPQSSRRLAQAVDQRDALQGEVVGRYTLHERIAAGGMASVYLGSMAGAAAFSRVVAIKRMHPQFATDDTFVERFRDEAWLSARLLHPSIVQTFDVVDRDGELLLVMEYVDGITLRILAREASLARCLLPVSVAAGILVPVLHGLHAAHEATDDEGHPLGIVHRDFSPHNIIIGRDGHSKILDFGIAKARTHHHVTSVGHLTGKFAYLSPEQILGTGVDRRADIFAAGIVLWETLSGRRLFREPDLTEAATIERVLNKPVPPPSRFNPTVPRQLDDITLHALRRDPSERFPTARQLALEIEETIQLASPSTIGACLSQLCASQLQDLSRILAKTRRHSVMGARSLAEPSDVPTVVVMPVNVTSTIRESSSEPEPSDSAPPHGWRTAARLAPALAVIGLAVWVCHSLGAPRSSEPPKEVAATAHIAIPVSPTLSALHIASVSDTTSAPAAHSEPDPAPVAQGQAAEERVVQEQATRGGSGASPTPRVLSATAAVPPRSRDAVRGSARGTQEGGRASRRAPTTSSVPSRPSDAAARSKCDPPTYLDSDGIRHFKDGCI